MNKSKLKIKQTNEKSKSANQKYIKKMSVTRSQPITQQPADSKLNESKLSKKQKSQCYDESLPSYVKITISLDNETQTEKPKPKKDVKSKKQIESSSS